MLYLNVTDEDIRAGRRGSSTSCPLARAARRALGGVISVGIHHLTYQVAWGSPITRYHLEQDALDFRADFDTGFTVEPGRYAMKKEGSRCKLD